MSNKKKKIDKNSKSIIVAIIGLIGVIITTIGAIVVAFIGKQNDYDYNVNKISKSKSISSIIKTDISKNGSKNSISGDTLKYDTLGEIFEYDSEDNPMNISENKLDNPGYNSGVNFNGNNSGDISVINNYDEEEIDIKKITLTGGISKIVTYGKNNEIVDSYYDNSSIPICNLQMSNGNKLALDIKNIFVEVVNCNVFNEVIDKNTPPDSWATMEKKIFWSCNISPEYKRYQSILLGYNENNTNDLSKTNYVNIAGHDTGQFELEIHPDTPGEYVINVIVEYIIDGKVVEAILPNVEFTYDPDTDYAIEPTLDVIGDIEFFE